MGHSVLSPSLFHRSVKVFLKSSNIYTDSESRSRFSKWWYYRQLGRVSANIFVMFMLSRDRRGIVDFLDSRFVVLSVHESILFIF